MTKEKFIEISEYLFKRLKEPSSHAAIATVFMNLGFSTNETTVSAFCYVISGMFALAGIIMKEKKHD